MRILWISIAAVLLAAAAVLLLKRRGAPSYVAVVGEGNALFSKGEVAAAAAKYAAAARLAPESEDVRMNVAIADLGLGHNPEAIAGARAALALDRNDPGAYYVMGCAQMHLFDWENAVRSFQQSQAIHPRVPAVSYQLGLAHEQLGQLPAAVHDLEECILLDPDHAGAHFRLSRLYGKLGREADAQAQTRALDDLLAKPGKAVGDAASLEACAYTQPRAPFLLAEPAVPGLGVRFVAATAAALGPGSPVYGGPIAVIDLARDGRNSLFVRDAASGNFVVLENHSGRFHPFGPPLPAPARAAYGQALVGDLDNKGLEDVVVLGAEGARVYRLVPGGKFLDYSAGSGLSDLRATSGLLADLDFTGNLDVVAVGAGGAGLQVFRNLGEFSFTEATDDFKLPTSLPGITALAEEDWGNDGLPTLFACRRDGPPAAFTEHRASGFAAGSAADGWPAASLLACGDLNNDLAADAVLVQGDALEVRLSGHPEPVRLPLGGFKVAGLLLADVDNDGWLDLIVYGPGGLRVWRNQGHAGFADVTAALGLAGTGPVSALVAADFFGGGAEDLAAVTPAGLALYRNEGAAPNHLLKLQLTGTRSNASALGVRIELRAGNWRTSRTVHALPIEIGTGSHAQIDTMTIHWTDVTTSTQNVAAGPYAYVEPKLPTGSCPYLYAWDGHRYRFVTDVLGAAPLGLPATRGQLVPSNPEELLNLGDGGGLPSRRGYYDLRVTDELRELLYLDQARLLVVDHPAGTRVLSTSKLVAGPTFAPPELWTLRPLGAPRAAVRSDGLDVTAALAAVDGQTAGPVALRRPQMRGYARPYGVTLDFGPLDVNRPLVLALTGWLQFGGGMANIAAALDPEGAPPFPRLEAERADGTWAPVATEVGAPCGKTKTILVDLAGRLPAGARRLRLTTAFEIYWDQALLCERLPPAGPARTLVAARADLHWRGFSQYEASVPGRPLTPDYARLVGTPYWDFTPAGWCTRYGDVRGLIERADDQLAILSGGDELALAFPAEPAPPPPGQARDFFLYLSGWDKDADFHVRRGAEVGPLPFHGMDDQHYGQATARAGRQNPDFDTRWVGPAVLERAPAPQY